MHAADWNRGLISNWINMIWIVTDCFIFNNTAENQCAVFGSGVFREIRDLCGKELKTLNY